MKMGYNKVSAHDIIHKLQAKDLELIFKHFGDEKNAKLIARKITQERNIKSIDTEKLVKLINTSKKILQKRIKQPKFFKLLEFW